jgi:hypothetical protein
MYHTEFQVTPRFTDLSCNRLLVVTTDYTLVLYLCRGEGSTYVWSVQQANCTAQPTAGEGGDSTVSTVSVAGTHTPNTHQCTRTDECKCSVQGGEECVPRMSHPPAPKGLPLGWHTPCTPCTDKQMVATHGANHRRTHTRPVPHNTHAYTTPPVPQHPERGTHLVQ